MTRPCVERRTPVCSPFERSMTQSRVLYGRRLAFNAQWRWFDFALIVWAALCALASVLFALNSRCRDSEALAGIGCIGVVLFAAGNVLYVGMAVWAGLARADVSAEPTDSAGPYRKRATRRFPGPPVSLAEMRAMLVPYAFLYLLTLGVFILFAVVSLGV